MAFPEKLSNLCAPALFYFIVSMIGLFLILLQNFGNKGSFRMGSFSCKVPNTILVFLLQVIYIIFWTWVLDLICRDGYKMISWLLVLLPWISMIFLVGMIAINK
jgi:hypothetical protein